MDTHAVSQNRSTSPKTKQTPYILSKLNIR